MLARLVLLAQAVPMKPPVEPKPPPAKDVALDWIMESLGDAWAPAVGAVVVALIVWGVIRAMRVSDMDGEQKARFKFAIIRLLRQNIRGLAAGAIAQELKLEAYQASRLLDEMTHDKVLDVSVDRNNVATYHLREFDHVHADAPATKRKR